MARYIDADREIRGLKNALSKVQGNETAQFVVDKVVKLLQESPTADVAEVKHGEWQRQKKGFYFICSVCGKAAATKGNFCHNCGAKMDKDGDAHGGE